MNHGLTIAVFNQKQKAVLTPVVVVTSNGKGSIFPLSLVNKLERGGWILLKKSFNRNWACSLLKIPDLPGRTNSILGLKYSASLAASPLRVALAMPSVMLPLFCPRVDRGRKSRSSPLKMNSLKVFISVF